MSTSLWRAAVTLLLGGAVLILSLVTAIILPIYGWFMIVWLHIPPFDIITTVGPAMMILGLVTYGMWRGIRRMRGNAG